MRRGAATAGVTSKLGAVGVLLSLTLTACGTTAVQYGSRPRAASPIAVASQAHIPASLLAGMRPIGAGARFHPLVTGAPTGGCASRPGPEEAHLELFAANRVVLIAAGVGFRSQPRRCYGNVATVDPTGIIHYRPGAKLQDVFRAWGEPLSATRMASFTGHVRYYLTGRRVSHIPALSEHAEIVIEVGPYVPPHRSFAFAPGL